MAARLQDIADELGVSASIVSRVLNNRPNSVSAKTRFRIVEKSRELGYLPNVSARFLRSGNTGIVAVWIVLVNHPFYGQYLEHLSRIARDDGYQLTIIELSFGIGDAQLDMSNSAGLKDGIIAIDLPGGARRYRARHVGGATPVVTIGVFPETEGDHVAVDLESGTLEALESLASSGRRNICYLTDDGAAIDMEPRYRAYRSFVAERNMPLRLIGTSAISRESAYTAVSDAIAAGNPIDAIFARNDIMAVGAYRAIKDAGLKIPDDISLIGCDATPDIAYFDTPLSTISMPVQEACENAWKFLRFRMANPDAPAQLAVLGSRLIKRESS